MTSASNPDNGRTSEITELLFAESVKRTIWFSYLMAGMCFLYGVTSLSFIRSFDPSVTLWTNLWPRIITGSLPSLFVGLYFQRSASTNQKKMLVSSIIFPILYQAQAWVHVWPIALNGRPDILTFVDGPNAYIIALMFTMTAPPRKHKVSFSMWFFSIFVLPLCLVALKGKNQIVSNLILTDTLIAFAGSFVLSSLFDKLREKVARLELERSEFAKGFLGEHLSKAIYEDRTDLLKRREVTGLVSAIDVRGYTALAQSNDKEEFSKFMDQYFELLSVTVKKHGGYIHKTSGDGHLISFGLFDHNPDLSDIPGLTNELEAADRRRLRATSTQAIECLDQIAHQAQVLFSQTNLHGYFRLGASLDLGPVEIKVVGEEKSRKELDIFGLTVIRSARLEAHTKAISELFTPTDSLIVVSESAIDFLSGYPIQIVDTSTRPVRDFPNIHKIGVIAKPATGIRLAPLARAAA